MAINLKKESYSNNADTDIAETVCHEQDSEENTGGNFYPRQVFPENYGTEEIYPQRKSSAENYYPKQAFPENYDVSEIYPAQSVQSENTAVSYKSSDKNVFRDHGDGDGTYPTAPPGKTKIDNDSVLAIVLAIVIIVILTICSTLRAETSAPYLETEPVNNYTYTVKEVTEPVTKEVTEPVTVQSDVTDSEEPDYNVYYDTFEYSTDEVDEIIIDGDFSFITVSQNYNSSIYVKTEKFCGYKYDVYVIDKTLTVSLNDDYADSVTVTLPAIYKGPVTVNSKSENSNVYFDAGKDINITAELGTVMLQDLGGSSASVSIEKGNIWITNCDLNKCDLYADDGDISIRNSNIMEKCTANSNGVINAYSSAFFSEFEACGQIGLENTAFGGRTSLISYNGYINGKKIYFKDIYIKAQNSSVNISTNASSDKYTVVSSSDENSTVRYEPSAPSGQGSNTIKLSLTDSEVNFKFGNGQK